MRNGRLRRASRRPTSLHPVPGAIRSQTRDEPWQIGIFGANEMELPAFRKRRRRDLETLIKKRLSIGSYTNAEANWTDEKRGAWSAHIDGDYLQAERGELIDGARPCREVQAMKVPNSQPVRFVFGYLPVIRITPLSTGQRRSRLKSLRCA